jgi:hypothetical protein
LYNKEVRVRVCEVVDALKYHTPTPDEQFWVETEMLLYETINCSLPQLETVIFTMLFIFIINDETGVGGICEYNVIP